MSLFFVARQVFLLEKTRWWAEWATEWKILVENISGSPLVSGNALMLTIDKVCVSILELVFIVQLILTVYQARKQQHYGSVFLLYSLRTKPSEQCD